MTKPSYLKRIIVFSQEHQAQGAAKVNSYAIRQNWHQGAEEEFLIIEPQHKKNSK